MIFPYSTVYFSSDSIRVLVSVQSSIPKSKLITLPAVVWSTVSAAMSLFPW